MNPNYPSAKIESALNPLKIRFWFDKLTSKHFFGSFLFNKIFGLDRSFLIFSIFLIVASVFIGLFVVLFVSLVGDRPVMLFALPVIIALGTMLIMDKQLFFIIILLFRAAGDIVLSSTESGVGFGAGGLINALIILIALLFVIERPAGFTKLIASIWAGVLLVALITFSYAPQPMGAFKVFIGLLSNFAMFVIAFYVVKTRADFQYFLRIIIFSSVLPVLYSFVVIAMNGSIVLSDNFRLQSTFGHANIFAFYLVLIISLVFYQLKNTQFNFSQAKRGILWGYMALLLCLLLLTKTRSAWVGSLIMFAVYGLMFERKFLVYLLIASSVAILIPSIRDRLLDLDKGNSNAFYAQLNSFAWRKLVWKSALEWMKPENYIAGYGLDSFLYYSKQFFPTGGNAEIGAHNTYVQWFFETGLIGVIATGWMYIRLLFTLRLGLEEDKLGTIIIITIVAEYLIFSYSDNMLFYLSFNWYYWFFLGSVCSIVVTSLSGFQTENQSVTQPSRFRLQQKGM